MGTGVVIVVHLIVGLIGGAIATVQSLERHLFDTGLFFFEVWWPAVTTLLFLSPTKIVSFIAEGGAYRYIVPKRRVWVKHPLRQASIPQGRSWMPEVAGALASLSAFFLASSAAFAVFSSRSATAPWQESHL